MNLQAKKDLDGAIAAFRQAISLDPISAANRTNLGAALQQKGNLDGALATHRRAVQLDPQSASARSTNLGAALQTAPTSVKLWDATTGRFQYPIH
jgi:Flp pilus assembly protein TadD